MGGLYFLLLIAIGLLILILLKQQTSGRSRTSDTQLEKRIQSSQFQLLDTLSQANERSLERYSQFERNISSTLANHTSLINQKLEQDFEKLNHNVERQLLRINDKVNERLDESFEKTNVTFQNILVRLTKIDEAQRKIEMLSTDIVSLQTLLSDKKSRGTFGEIQLYQIMASIFGERNDRIYKMQYRLTNQTIVDAMLFAPEPLGNLPIDSKFPLENYQRMVDRTLGEIERTMAEKQFKQDVKKHIDDIANKYVAAAETSDQAIMFLPAEAIFAEINAYHPELIEYSQRRRVWIVSPTTFMSTLTTIQVILNNLERDRHARVIQLELQKLGSEFKRYKERWDKLSKHIETVSKDVKDIHVTTEKIGNRFDSISNVELDEASVLNEK